MSTFLGKVCYIPRWVAFNAQEIVEEISERKRKNDQQEELKKMIIQNQELISKLLDEPKYGVERQNSDAGHISRKSSNYESCNPIMRQLSNPADHSAPF